MNNQSRRNLLPAQLRVYSRRSWLKTALFGVGALSALGYWRTLAHGKRAAIRSLHGGVFPCAPGSWGTLECERMILEPRENVFDLERYERPVRWFFKGYSRLQVRQFLVSAGIAEKAVNALSDLQFSEESEGVVFTPRIELNLGLTAECREKIYNTLSADSDYNRYFDIFAFEPEYLELTLQQAGLTAATVQLFRSLLYKRGNLRAFSDVPLVLATLPDPAAKKAFLKILVRRPALTVRLKIDSATDLNGLVSYWGANGRTKEVQSILERFARKGGSAGISIIDLLPAFVRKRANTFPVASDPLEIVQNCHWTSLNFFNDSPNSDFLYVEGVENELTTNYARITTVPQLGDVVLFRDSAHHIVHSAVFIADKIVFTKNGEGPSQPWCFMSVTDVIDFYTCMLGRMSVNIYRRKLA